MPRRARRSIARSPSRRTLQPRTLPGAVCFWRPTSTGAERKRSFAVRWRSAPNDGAAKFALGIQLATFGEVDQAIELTRQALATEPLRANWYMWLAGYLSGLNRLDEAERAVRRAIELQPGAASYHQVLTIIEVQRGHAQAALAAAQQEPPRILAGHALALARQIGSDRSAADAALQTLIDKDAERCSLPDRASLRAAQRCEGDLRVARSGLEQPRCGYVRSSSTTPSSCATRTIRASPRSAARSDYPCPAKPQHASPPDASFCTLSASHKLSGRFWERRETARAARRPSPATPGAARSMSAPRAFAAYGTRSTLELHSAGRSERERLHRELQWKVPRRMSERALVPGDGTHHRAVADRVQH